MKFKEMRKEHVTIFDLQETSYVHHLLTILYISNRRLPLVNKLSNEKMRHVTICLDGTLPETNKAPLKIGRAQKETIVFQPSICRCYVTVLY